MKTDLLTETYRPKNFDEFISYEDNSFIEDIERCINEEPFGLPNMIL